MAKRAMLFGSRRTALWVGYAGVIIGSYALYEAYDKRGRTRPFGTRFLPGP